MVKKEMLKQIDDYLAKEGEARLVECGFKRDRVDRKIVKDHRGYECHLDIYNKYNIELKAEIWIDFPDLENGWPLKPEEKYARLMLTVDPDCTVLFESKRIKSFDEFEKAFNDLIYYLIKKD